MAEESRHMDDAFKRMSEEMNSEKYRVPYKSSFWEDAKAKLEDDQLDSAFRDAAKHISVTPAFSDSSSIDDIFMDSAFVDAASEQSVDYDSSYFKEFLEKESDLIMDDAFTAAAASTMVDYVPEYWSEADEALQKEGLHYEYHTKYWDEAKRLLDRSDRRKFFTKWAAAATLLLLISFSTPYLLPDNASDFDLEPKVAEEINLRDLLVEENSSNNQSEINLKSNQLNEFDVVDNVSETNNNNDNQVDQIDENTVHHDEVYTIPTIESKEDGTVKRPQESGSSEVLEPSRINKKNSIVKNPLSVGGTVELASEHFNRIEKSENLGNYDNNNVALLESPQISKIAYSAPKIKLIKPKPFIVHSLSALATTGIGNKWGEFDFVPTLRNSFGVEYVLASGKTLKSFEFGANFMINHVRQNKLGVERRASVYNVSGNVNKYWSKLQLKDMFYANLNLLASYTVVPKHKIQFGFGVEHLISVRSNMSYITNPKSEIQTVNNNWGVKDGLNKLDFRFSLGYEYQMFNAFSLVINSQFGMLDRTDDKFLNVKQKDTEIGVTIGLKYNIMRRVK